ncbi:MAG: flavin reductase family protein [Flavisolibacter sp.]
MHYQKLVIKNIREELSDFKTFEFEDGPEIKAGQYLTFVHKTLHEEIRRSYSITSAPLLHEPLTIGVKRIDNGVFSRLLTDLVKQGDILYTTGAGGFFTLPENIASCKQMFFFAAGSGITPIYSLIKTCLNLHPDVNVVLIYSNASPAQTIFYEQLQKLEYEFPKTFRLHFLFSINPELTKARLNKELLIELVKEYAVIEKEEILFYICGPEAYLRMCTYALQEEHVPKENIRRENFNLDKLLPAKTLPSDQDSHQLTVYYEGMEYSFIVGYPDTILKAAKKNGVILPYSCETGRCGSCVAKCISGKVWLSYNEVLTDKELANGLTLTCVGHPVGGDVVLKV